VLDARAHPRAGSFAADDVRLVSPLGFFHWNCGLRPQRSSRTRLAGPHLAGVIVCRAPRRAGRHHGPPRGSRCSAAESRARGRCRRVYPNRHCDPSWRWWPAGCSERLPPRFDRPAPVAVDLCPPRRFPFGRGAAAPNSPGKASTTAVPPAAAARPPWAPAGFSSATSSSTKATIHASSRTANEFFNCLLTMSSTKRAFADFLHEPYQPCVANPR
jgi:hypothetical protein